MHRTSPAIILAGLLLAIPRLAVGQSPEPQAEETLSAMVETYHQAVQAKDETVLREDLYRGEIPGDNRRFLRALFERTEQLDMTLETRELRIEAERAVVVIDCTLAFRHATTGEQKTAHYTLRLIFEASDGGWRLKKFERA